MSKPRVVVFLGDGTIKTFASELTSSELVQQVGRSKQRRIRELLAMADQENSFGDRDKHLKPVK